jgi:ribonuclease HII
MIHIYIDEAGRWPLAGPVYVGLILWNKSVKAKEFKNFKDSKKLSEKQRETLFAQLKQSDIIRSYGKSSARYIDMHGIVWAIRHAIVQGVKRLFPKPDWSDITLHIDGNTDFGLRKKFPWLTVCTYIKGDDRIPVISAASIIAKVSRDREMLKLDKKYSLYWFAQHKGYGTQQHRTMIATHGLSFVHRKSFCKNLVAL